MINRLLLRTTPAALLLVMAATAPSAQAQTATLGADPMTEAKSAAARRDPAEALSRYLRVLAAQPRDLDALMGAGRAALDIGDPSAAIGFYARAEEIAPRNPRVKAGLGSAMVQMENAGAALRLFEDAVLLGMEEAEIAGDRGLARDLRGENKYAQQDYALSLRRREDSEIRRRLTLSIAISGDQAGALAILDPLLRRQDVGAWRVRAFVLALTGDVPGAESAAYAVMPKSQAAALAPFLARLPGLRPSQKAAAVHFGHFPSDGRRYSQAELFADAAGSSAHPLPPGPRSDAGLIPSGSALGVPPAETVLSGPRRRPGTGDQAASPPKPVQAPPSKPVPAKPVETPVRAAAALPTPPRAPFGPPAPPPEDRPVVTPPPAAAPVAAGPAPVVKRIDLPASAPPAVVPAARPAPGANPELAKIVAALKEMPEPKAEAPVKTASKEPVKAKELDGAKPDAKTKDVAKAKDSKTKAAPKEPERHWVQIAGGANKAALPRQYAQLKEKWPKLLSGRSAWTTPLRATNRLLVGPFKTAAEAQAFVNSSSKEGLSTFAFTSEAGQEIEKLAAK